MAVLFPLPAKWRRWKLKIRDRERLEPPHVSLLKGTECWRIDLRTAAILDREPDPAAVPRALRQHMRKNRNLYIKRWNELDPENPV